CPSGVVSSPLRSRPSVRPIILPLIFDRGIHSFWVHDISLGPLVLSSLLGMQHPLGLDYGLGPFLVWPFLWLGHLCFGTFRVWTLVWALICWAGYFDCQLGFSRVWVGLAWAHIGLISPLD